VPSVRGRTRWLVAAILIGTGTTTAALVGLVAGVLFQFAPSATIEILIALALVAVVADIARLRFGHPIPLSIGRQVPVEWGRLFDPRVVALLYGARLGVGPLTMLSTWLWWAATIGAALTSVATSVMIGVVFGVVRLLITVIASQRADRAGHASWFGNLRSHTTGAWLSLDGIAAVLALVTIGAR
jgi:hypothetical protein